MTVYSFDWNPLTDQPHNVASRRERLLVHLRNIKSYLSLLPPNLKRLYPMVKLYYDYRRQLYQQPVAFDALGGVAVSPRALPAEEALTYLKELGVQRTLVRLPSWEREKLASYQDYIQILRKGEMEVMVALLQNRDDVLDPARWEGFLLEVRDALDGLCRDIEIGHAWNRTKWGIWTYQEYLQLARPAFSLIKESGFRALGPAVIDFEFHLYPPVLQEIDFEPVTSLLYVDRVGAPENKQFGWSTSAKVALLKAMVDGATDKKRELWVTEVNWPLAGTGDYSPAAGKPNVSEEEQANFLVRYYLLVGATGLVRRIYWWQLVAPGYGLIDSRDKVWRQRPAYYALKTMTRILEGAQFLKVVPGLGSYCFLFGKKEQKIAVCWRHQGEQKVKLPFLIDQGITRDGESFSVSSSEMVISERPVYLFLRQEETEESGR